VQCQICNKNEATLHFKQVAEGSVKDLYVCEKCAAENGLDPHSPLSVTDFLFGLGMKSKDEEKTQDRTCPACGMRTRDFKKTSRLGCAQCYEVFSEPLAPLLSSVHKGTRHRGKVPARERVAVRVAGLREKLNAAVATQDFEEAARLRDQIKGLKTGDGAAPAEA